jgi:valyl-tRNA synthetase
MMVSGFVTLKGEKMSKSKGNVIDPKEVMDKYGSDALRFWAASSKVGEDTDFQEKELVAGKKFVNKIVNASKFVFMNLEDFDGRKPKKLVETDRDFLIELDRIIYLATSHFENYEYSRVKFNTEDFFWKFFCDIYLEAVKGRIYQGKGDDKKSAQYTLYKSLLTILKLIAPIMPFITEEIYQTYFRKTEKDKSIHLSKWPKCDKGWIGKWDDKKVKSHANKLTLFRDLLTQVRGEKTKARKSMNAECIITLSKVHKEDLGGKIEDFKNVTNSKEIKEGKFKVEFV